MKLRNIVEPDMETTQSRYPDVLKSLLDYANYCDENGDEDMTEYEILETSLRQITGKDISRFNLSEWWEEEGAEVLAFKISLPDPIKVKDLSREEVQEIIRRLKSFEEPEVDDNSFSSQFRLYLDSYYHNFLALNCGGYQLKLFQRNRDKSGKYFEYSVDEILEKIW